MSGKKEHGMFSTAINYIGDKIETIGNKVIGVTNEVKTIDPLETISSNKAHFNSLLEECKKSSTVDDFYKCMKKKSSIQIVRRKD